MTSTEIITFSSNLIKSDAFRTTNSYLSSACLKSFHSGNLFFVTKNYTEEYTNQGKHMHKAEVTSY